MLTLQTSTSLLLQKVSICTYKQLDNVNLKLVGFTLDQFYDTLRYNSGCFIRFLIYTCTSSENIVRKVFSDTEAGP